MFKNVNRRTLLKASATAGLSAIAPTMVRSSNAEQGDAPILVVVELSGGNDGLNTVVPYADDAYYRARPNLGLPKSDLHLMDDHFGFNPGALGFHRLWQEGQLAVVHGCGYARPSYSHFTSMAYWHTGAPHGGNEFGWLGRTADNMARERRDNMLVNVGSSQSLAVKSKNHTPVVFDDPERFSRDAWLGRPEGADEMEPGSESSIAVSPNHAYLRAVSASAARSSRAVQAAWRAYTPKVDYGIAPMDLPKVAACIKAGLPTQLYHVSFRNNSFDTHVQQAALHRRLLSYAADGIYGFVKDLEAIGESHRVAVLVFSEFGRRVVENANLGTDHGSANVMFMAGEPVKGGHYGVVPSLTELVDGDNLAYTTDFRQVYATAIEGFLGVDSSEVFGARFEPLPIFS